MNPLIKSPKFSEKFDFAGKHWINEDIILYVPTQFPNLKQALDWLENKIWPESVTVTIKILAGEYNIFSQCPITLRSNVTITGDTVLQKNIISLSSTTGSSANWSVTLNVNNTTNLAVGMFALISITTGTGDFRHHNGCWIITAIPSSTQLTLKNTSRKSTFVSTLSGGIIDVPQTRLNCGALVNNSVLSALNVEKIAIKEMVIFSNTGTTNGNGISLFNCLSISIDTVGISNFYIGISSIGGILTMKNLYSSNNGYGADFRTMCNALYEGVFYINGNYYGVSIYDQGKFGANYQFTENTQLGNVIDAWAQYSSIARISPHYETISPALNTVGNFNSYITIY